MEQIARDFQITEHFDVMAGSLLDGGRTDKAQVIEEFKKTGSFSGADSYGRGPGT